MVGNDNRVCDCRSPAVAGLHGARDVLHHVRTLGVRLVPVPSWSTACGTMGLVADFCRRYQDAHQGGGGTVEDRQLPPQVGALLRADCIGGSVCMPALGQGPSGYRLQHRHLFHDRCVFAWRGWYPACRLVK